MFDFLGNPLILLAIVSPLLLFLGILVGNALSQPRKNRVLKLSPETGRGVELEVNEEDELNIRCDPVGNIPPQRFIKLHDAFNIVKKGWFKIQNYALWFAYYGSAYVRKLEGEDVDITLETAIFNIFGKTLYDQIPREQKDQIEASEIGITVSFPNKPLTPLDPKTKESLPSISSDDLRRGDVDQFIGALARGINSLSKTASGDWTKISFILGTGIAIGIVLSLIFKWGAPVIVPST